jgi:hypothetical protein
VERKEKMKASRYTEKQIISILKEAEAGIKHGRKRCTSFEGSGGGEENRRLKKLIAEQALDIEVLNKVSSKNF